MIYFVHIFTVFFALVNIGCDKSSGYHEIHHAVQFDDLQATEEFLRHGTSINSKDDSGRMPIHWARSVAMAKLLLSKGTDLHALSEDGSTPLHFSAFDGYYDLTEYYIDQGANIHAVNDKGDTPVHNAAYMGHVAILKLLIEHGADINKQNHYGERPIFQAIAENRIEATKLLIEAGDNMSAIPRGGDYITPLEKALMPLPIYVWPGESLREKMDREKPRYRNELIKIILDSMDVNSKSKDSRGENLLHQSIRRLDTFPAYREVVPIIIDRIDNINETTKVGSTALDLLFNYARKQDKFIEVPKDENIMNLLLSHGAKRGTEENLLKDMKVSEISDIIDEPISFYIYDLDPTKEGISIEEIEAKIPNINRGQFDIELFKRIIDKAKYKDSIDSWKGCNLGVITLLDGTKKYLAVSVSGSFFKIIGEWGWYGLAPEQGGTEWETEYKKVSLKLIEKRGKADNIN